jgi:hypothetical protein
LTTHVCAEPHAGYGGPPVAACSSAVVIVWLVPWSVSQSKLGA